MIARRLLCLALALSSALLAASSCTPGEGRFPACKSDKECTERSTAATAPRCVELRCVACGSDADCPPAHACVSGNECRRLTETPVAEGGDAGVIEKETWVPSTKADYDRCIAACRKKPKQQECTKRCGKPPKP